jgi:hypothetical protein
MPKAHCARPANRRETQKLQLEHDLNIKTAPYVFMLITSQLSIGVGSPYLDRKISDQCIYTQSSPVQSSPGYVSPTPSLLDNISMAAGPFLEDETRSSIETASGSH